MGMSTRATWVRRARLLKVVWLVFLGLAAASDHPAMSGIVSAASVPPPLNFFSVTPCRVVDTRSAGAPLAAGVERTFPFTGAPCGVPATAVAVSVNVAVTQPTAAGNVRLYPAGSAVPISSAINYAAGQTRTNNTVVGLGVAGALAAQCLPAGSTHLIVDVNGYFEGLCPAPTQSCYTGPPGTEDVLPGTLPEVCNGVDDNCDGTIDEGCP